MVTAVRTAGAKGNHFLPDAKRGNNSAPVRQVGDERGTGASEEAMPKTARHIWKNVLEWENLLRAAREASRGKRYRREVLFFNARLEENLLQLRRLLQAGTWKPGQYRQFFVFEPKRRLIHAPAFADRVLHHALVQVIGPYFERRFVFQSFACRMGKGTHAASEYLTGMLRKAAAGPVYVLKADVEKYFYSIDHEILLRVAARTIGDPDVLHVLRALVTKNGCIEGGRGLPLGALTSQLLANAYLDQLDHYIKDTLGVRFYVRYMDDFVILHHDKAELWRLLAEIRDFLACELHLNLNRKTRVFPVSQGVDFAGYRHWPDHTLPRRRNVARAKKRFRGLSRLYARGEIGLDTVRASMASFTGYMKHCDGWRTCGSALDRLVLRRPHKAEGEE